MPPNPSLLDSSTSLPILSPTISFSCKAPLVLLLFVQKHILHKHDNPLNQSLNPSLFCLKNSDEEHGATHIAQSHCQTNFVSRTFDLRNTLSSAPFMANFACNISVHHKDSVSPRNQIWKTHSYHGLEVGTSSWTFFDSSIAIINLQREKFD